MIQNEINYSKKIYIMAGEPSGDLIGAKLISELAVLGDFKFSGIGGEKMIEQGFQSLFPMSEISIMGFVEILPVIFKMISRINQTVQDIIDTEPDVVISIDSPGFFFRVIEKIRKKNILKNTKFIHYVAPTVWAYKPERAKKVAKLYDHLFTILPFENQYFTKFGLECTFVGHPLTQVGTFDNQKFRKNHKLSTEDFVLCICPGSRVGEIKHLLPIFIRAVNIFIQQFPETWVVIPTFHHLRKHVEDQVVKLKTNKIIIGTDIADKRDIISTSDLALTKCGTITNQFAFHKVPMVAAYRVNPISAFIIKMMLHIKHVSLINILAEKEVIEEYLQADATPEKLASALIKLKTNKQMAENQVNECQIAIKKLFNVENISPSYKAALKIMELIT